MLIVHSGIDDSYLHPLTCDPLGMQPVHPCSPVHGVIPRGNLLKRESTRVDERVGPVECHGPCLGDFREGLQSVCVVGFGFNGDTAEDIRLEGPDDFNAGAGQLFSESINLVALWD